ncbi:MAG: hypothetical protein P1U85_16010 [Verrucomicrobiales bacterium]|jgi:hypothetical protein|nr:hypothetical protein [Verrucomicrobiales bacterium]
MKTYLKLPASAVAALLALFGASLLTSCGEKSTEIIVSEEAVEAKSSAVLSPVFLKEKPGAATPVLELRKSGKPGDQVVVAGKVGGAMSPFTEGFATFVLADRSLKTCDLIPEDLCESPWDACCEAPEVIKASRLTIQVLDGDNGPVAESLQMVEGLSELDELIVTGEIAEGSNEENMIVNATGIFLEKQWVAPKPEEKKKG